MWTSKTKQFGEGEMGMLEFQSAEQLVQPLLGSDPIVALRGLAEIMLNRDTAKLDLLLANTALNEHWQRYESDHSVDARDRANAQKLHRRLTTRS